MLRQQTGLSLRQIRARRRFTAVLRQSCLRTTVIAVNVSSPRDALISINFRQQLSSEPRWARDEIADHEDNPVVEEITSTINSLPADEQIDLAAFAWLGRDDYAAADWPAVRKEAARARNDRTASRAA